MAMSIMEKSFRGSGLPTEATGEGGVSELLIVPQVRASENIRFLAMPWKVYTIHADLTESNMLCAKSKNRLDSVTEGFPFGNNPISPG